MASLINVCRKKWIFPFLSCRFWFPMDAEGKEEEESLINILFGRRNIQRIRRLITFIRYSSQAFLIPRADKNLSEYLKGCGENIPLPSVIHDWES